MPQQYLEVITQNRTFLIWNTLLLICLIYELKNIVDLSLEKK